MITDIYQSVTPKVLHQQAYNTICLPYVCRPHTMAELKGRRPKTSKGLLPSLSSATYLLCILSQTLHLSDGLLSGQTMNHSGALGAWARTAAARLGKKGCFHPLRRVLCAQKDVWACFPPKLAPSTLLTLLKGIIIAHIKSTNVVGCITEALTPHLHHHCEPCEIYHPNSFLICPSSATQMSLLYCRAPFPLTLQVILRA